MYHITIQYAVPDDPAAVDEHDRTTHVPLVAPLPGLQRFTWSTPRPLGGEQNVHLVAELDFADGAALKAALASPEIAASSKGAASTGVATTMLFGEIVEASL